MLATENVIIEWPEMAKPNYKMETASSVQKKDKMADRTPRRLCVSHSSSFFCGEGTGLLRSSGEKILGAPNEKKTLQHNIDERILVFKL